MEKSIQDFYDIPLQLRKNEVWRHVDFTALFADGFALPQPSSAADYDFRCHIPDLQTLRLALVNGYCHEPLRTTDQGVVMGSLSEAKMKHPELVAKCLGQCAKENHPYLQANTDGYADGLFVYVPDKVVVEQPVQLLSVLSAESRIFVQARNVVYVGEGSSVKLIHCDDTYTAQQSMSNNVTEIYAATHATVQHYKMQNLNDRSGLLNQTYMLLHEGCELRSVAVTLNGGMIRNHTEIRMAGEHCDVQAHGLYLNDKTQQVDNYIFIDHQQPNCTSRELFKGILDDAARGRFNGHVLVHDGATKTEAYQTNRNILLTDKAFIETKPFLEIYNDDVKCSHGSTIGQLDEQALFYIRTRGISERIAKALLLYAFCDEVIQQIDLPALRSTLSDMVKKRLHGELSGCSECALQCNTPCNGPEANFKIDITKL